MHYIKIFATCSNPRAVATRVMVTMLLERSRRLGVAREFSIRHPWKTELEVPSFLPHTSGVQALDFRGPRCRACNAYRFPDRVPCLHPNLELEKFTSHIVVSSSARRKGSSQRSRKTVVNSSHGAVQGRPPPETQSHQWSAPAPSSRGGDRFARLELTDAARWCWAHRFRWLEIAGAARQD